MLGVLLTESPPEKAFESFQKSLARLDKKSIMAFKQFYDLPTKADLQGKCSKRENSEYSKHTPVGVCDLKLTAEMIERFHNEIDWEGPNYVDRVTDWFRKLILASELDYRRAMKPR